LHNKKQFDETARALACLYATYLMGWRENSPRREKELIALAACTIVCYDLDYIQQHPICSKMYIKAVQVKQEG
jgi:hypothetical protein